VCCCKDQNFVCQTLNPKSTPKRYEKKFDIIINSLVPMELTPLSRKKEIDLFVESQVIMHLNA